MLATPWSRTSVKPSPLFLKSPNQAHDAGSQGTRLPQPSIQFAPSAVRYPAAVGSLGFRQGLLLNRLNGTREPDGSDIGAGAQPATRLLDIVVAIRGSLEWTPEEPPGLSLLVSIFFEIHDLDAHFQVFGRLLQILDEVRAKYEADHVG